MKENRKFEIERQRKCKRKKKNLKWRKHEFKWKNTTKSA